MSLRFDQLIGMWLDGEQRIAAADSGDRYALERARDQIVYELRRRLGGPFTTSDLAALYNGQGTDWCFDIARRAVPRNPAAWDVPVVAGAAFARYSREASDYGGGRRIEERD